MLAVNVIVKLSSRIPTDREEGKDETDSAPYGRGESARSCCLSDRTAGAAGRANAGSGGKGLCAALENVCALVEGGRHWAVSSEA